MLWSRKSITSNAQDTSVRDFLEVNNPPFFSVVIPTHRRPHLLKRAIHSVIDQTYQNWELVISDDEDPPGETWEFLEKLSLRDSRIQPLRNRNKMGQVGNTNSAIAHSLGAWIKPLHDDDLLYPNCLESLHGYLSDAGISRKVGLASCRADRIDGKLRQPWVRRRNQPLAEIIDQQYVVLAMYLQDDVGSFVPSCICIRRSTIIANDAWMPQHPNLISSVDSHWSTILGALSDLLIINRALVAKQAEPSSITGAITDQAIDREVEIIRDLQHALIPPELKPPSPQVAKQALCLFRAAHRLVRRRRILEAASLVRKAWHPAAWWLATRMATARISPKAFGTPRRTVPEPYGTMLSTKYLDRE